MMKLFFTRTIGFDEFLSELYVHKLSGEGVRSNIDTC